MGSISFKKLIDPLGLFTKSSTDTAPAPTVSTQPTTDVAADKTAADSNASRAALYATQGGAAGAVLNSDDVQKRQTLLGN